MENLNRVLKRFQDSKKSKKVFAFIVYVGIFAITAASLEIAINFIRAEVNAAYYENNNTLSPLAAFVAILVLTYLLIILILSLLKIIKKAAGSEFHHFTTEIDGKEYLAVMRNDKESWLCFPVERKVYSNKKCERSSKLLSKTIFYYKKGTLSPKKLSDMSNIALVDNKASEIRDMQYKEK